MVRYTNKRRSLQALSELEAGKMGDVVIWNGTPFSVYALATVQAQIDPAGEANDRNQFRTEVRLALMSSLARAEQWNC